ncbi:hypothetical protein [Dactylosporangium salmoneum]|uniref:Uncharacterized protein n=1 Tax=Dactylosporangium salmoneum TaxID=53361 RepID=A0ABN3GWI0_9ACTN
MSAAGTARREILAELPAPPHPAGLDRLIWQRGAQVRGRRLPRAAGGAGKS